MHVDPNERVSQGERAYQHAERNASTQTLWGWAVSVIIHRLDSFLEKLKRGEEHCVDSAGAAHGDTQTPIHVAVEETYLDGLNLLALGVHQRVALIDALCGIDRV